MKPLLAESIMLPVAGRFGKILLLSLIGLLPLGLSGCATKRLKVDFTGFEKAYAETSNQEMLLNLARLENRDPTYFFKIGQITSAYKMNVSLAGSSGYQLQTTNVAAGSPTGTGTPGAIYENDPIFTFIPVNDETNAQLLLKPIPAESFYFLYEQGWRVDQLVRLMVDRFEVTRYDGNGRCSVETIRNTPPADYLKDPDGLSSYTTFLRVNAIIYWLQRHGFLLLRGQNTFQPYSLDNNSGLDTTDKNGSGPSANAPKGQDFVNAAQKGAVWELQPTEGDPRTLKWVLGEKVFSPNFSLYPLAAVGTKLGPDIKTIRNQILADPEMSGLKEGPALLAVLSELAAGFTIEGTATQGTTVQPDACSDPTSKKSTVSVHLVLRSLIGLMAAAAQEQDPYEAIEKGNPLIPPSPYLTPAQAAALGPAKPFLEEVPAIERIPLLRLKGGGEDEQMAPIVQLNYRGINYRIADEKATVGTDNQYWNRDVFRLINELTSQVTVDISKFPLTEILQ
jgi:hypothetical protein